MGEGEGERVSREEQSSAIIDVRQVLNKLAGDRERERESECLWRHRESNAGRRETRRIRRRRRVQSEVKGHTNVFLVEKGEETATGDTRGEKGQNGGDMKWRL